MYEQEREAALEAVLRAARVCEDVRKTFVASDTHTKDDRSPVTVADFGAQAVMIERIRNLFPADEIVGEEDAEHLQTADGAGMAAAVLRAVSPVLAGLDRGGLTDLLAAGSGTGGAGKRFWTLDPIDGTKGYIRGDQYAVALALIEDGQVVLGVLGCPGLPQDALRGEGPRGILLEAVRGEATVYCHPLGAPTASSPVRVRAGVAPADAVFCESVEKAHTAQSRSARLAQRLGVLAPPVRLDSQCKYAVVARGEADVYLRLPAKKGYTEKIWDHAAGAFLVEQACGRVTDMDGRELDYSQGRTLTRNRGIVATGGGLQDRILAALRQDATGGEQGVV